MSVRERLRQVLEGCPEVQLAYLFGSAVRDPARRGRDVDVAIWVEGGASPELLDRLTADLEARVGRPIDLVDLSTAPPLLAHEVLATGELLVCRDEETRVRFAARALARFLDTAHLRAVQHSYLRQHAEAHRGRPG